MSWHEVSETLREAVLDQLLRSGDAGIKVAVVARRLCRSHWTIRVALRGLRREGKAATWPHTGQAARWMLLHHVKAWEAMTPRPAARKRRRRAPEMQPVQLVVCARSTPRFQASAPRSVFELAGFASGVGEDAELVA